MDWSSPRSTQMRRIRGSAVPAAAGTSQPHWEISTSIPTAFKATDFPPAFGPLITSTFRSRSTTRSRGTTASRSAIASSSSGWRAATSRNVPSPEISAGFACMSRLQSVPAWTASTRDMNAAASRSGSRWASTRLLSSRMMRAISALISSRISTRSFCTWTASAGSTKMVPPLLERSWTRPWIRRCAPERRGMQNLSPRIVISGPLVQPFVAADSMTRATAARAALSRLRRSRLRRDSRGEASSRIRPSPSNARAIAAERPRNAPSCATPRIQYGLASAASRK